MILLENFRAIEEYTRQKVKNNIAFDESCNVLLENGVIQVLILLIKLFELLFYFFIEQFTKILIFIKSRIKFYGTIRLNLSFEIFLFIISKNSFKRWIFFTDQCVRDYICNF